MADRSTRPAPTDRRTQRTRNALRGALLALMHEVGWDEIDVRRICARADVGRSTFYNHFTSKDDLLSGSFDDLRRRLREGARAGSRHDAGAAAPSPRQGRPRLVFALGLMEHAWENRRLFRTLIGRRSGHAVHERFKQMVVALVDDDLADIPAGVPRDATVRWTAGALFELLIWWMEARNPVPPEQLLAMLQRLAPARA
ncbi:MAG: TetR/AcrR family transcriptional regulator [Burkholderiales bacterium]|nr:TetR/AcrR family transcriptional regulator [Burkholderiales bacterium]